MPLKYRLLLTINALQGRGYPWFLIHGDFWWVFHQLFTALTRPTEPPVMVGEPLDGLKGCCGIVNASIDTQELYNKFSQKLGVHPKVVILFADAYGKSLDPDLVAAARRWLDGHNAGHRTQLESELKLFKARQLGGDSTRNYDI